MENENQKYDKIIVDFEFSDEDKLRELLENKKISLILVTNQVEKLNQNIKNNIKTIVDKSQKNELLKHLEVF